MEVLLIILTAWGSPPQVAHYTSIETCKAAKSYIQSEYNISEYKPKMIMLCVPGQTNTKD